MKKYPDLTAEEEAHDKAVARIHGWWSTYCTEANRERNHNTEKEFEAQREYHQALNDYEADFGRKFSMR